jgi:hypothetical protein
VFALIASIFLAVPSGVLADAITYNFSGTLEGTVHGTNQFTGSFTVNSNPVAIANFPPPDYQASGLFGAKESGSDVSVTFQVAGHVINFSNSAQNPDIAQFSVQQLGNPAATVPGPLSDYATLSGGIPNPGLSATINGFEFNFANSLDTLFMNAVAGQMINLAKFNFANVSAAEIDVGSEGWRTALISSIQPAAFPEPSMVVVFATLIIAGLAHHRSRPVTNPVCR